MPSQPHTPRRPRWEAYEQPDEATLVQRIPERPNGHNGFCRGHGYRHSLEMDDLTPQCRGAAWFGREATLGLRDSVCPRCGDADHSGPCP